MAIMTPDSPMALSLLDAVNSPELSSVLAAKRQEIEAKRKIEAGVPWWKVLGDRTTFYSGNKPETSNNQWLGENGGPVSEGDYARSRMGNNSPQTAPITASDEAAYQRVYGPKDEPAPFTGPALGSIDPVFKKPRSEFTPDELTSYNQRQADRDTQNAKFKAGVMDQRATFDKSQPGIIANAQKLQRQMGISPQQAISLATAIGNQELKPDSLLGSMVLGAPQVAQAGVAGRADVDVANARNQGALGVANANNAANQQINQQNNDARANFLKQQNQGAVDQEMVRRGFAPNGAGVQQAPQPPMQGPMMGNDTMNALGNVYKSWLKIPTLDEGLPPQQGRVMSPQGGIPGYTQLPPTIEQQMAQDDRSSKNKLMGIQTQMAQSQLDDTLHPEAKAVRDAVVQEQLRKNIIHDSSIPLNSAGQKSMPEQMRKWGAVNDTSEMTPEMNSVLKQTALSNYPMAMLNPSLGGDFYEEKIDAFDRYVSQQYGAKPGIGAKWYRENFTSQPGVLGSRWSPLSDTFNDPNKLKAPPPASVYNGTDVIGNGML